MRSFTALLAFAVLATARPILDARAADCTGTISSLNDVAAAVKCTTITINAFTVTAGKTFELDLLDGTTVNMAGNVTFGVSNWAGPLLQIDGDDITFNGNGHTFDGQGPEYWDGQGGNGGVTKPAPMITINMSGTYSNVKVLNSPARCYSVHNGAPLVMSGLTIDDSLGDQPNSASGSSAAGHNTDGFDVGSHDLTIKDSTIMNQDDCLAINKGSNIVFTGNTCSGGHGISIGSISSDATVSGVVVTNNKIVNNDQALRIKTKADATDASVTNVTYSGNTATGTKKYGVIIDQSYPSTLGTPGNGVALSDVNFVGTKNTIAVASGAQRVAVNCGSSSCTGTWDWSALTVTGGKAGTINYKGITGFTQ